MARNHMTVDRERRVLEAMTPGMPYETRELATASGLTLVQARDTLERMMRRGGVARVKPQDRNAPSTWRRV